MGGIDDPNPRIRHPIRDPDLRYISAGVVFWRQNSGVFHDAEGVRRIRACPAGTPDVIGMLKGRFVGIELKRPKSTGRRKGKQQEDQEKWQRNCERGGGIYILARSVEDVVERLRKEGLV